MSTLPKLSSDELCKRGRPRDEEARRRILQAAFEVVESVGFANTTVDAIAERAGASKATIYRWWPHKAAVIIEAFRQDVSPELPFPDTGSFAEDLRVQLRNFIRMLNGRRGRLFKALIAASQNDPDVAEAFRAFWIVPRRLEAKAGLERNRERGDLRCELDLDLVLDLLYGPVYYRLLTGHGPLNCEFADSLAAVAFHGLATVEQAPGSRR